MSRGEEPGRLRIALVAPLWFNIAPAARGGIENFLHTLTQELVRRGHAVTLFASGDSVSGAALRAVCPRGLADLMDRGEAYEYPHYANANLAEAIREAASFDVIHSHIGCAWVPFSAICPTPILHSLHSFVTIDDDWVLRQYPEAAVSAVSRHQVAPVTEWRRRSIRIIYNGCDFGGYAFSPVPGKYLAFLGRMSPQKSPLDAIRVAKAVGMPLILAGAPLQKAEEAYFETQVKPLIDGRDVQYIGRVDHARKSELLKNAAALLFPIRDEETFGIVMVEAMACGTPVLACDKGAVREVIDSGKTGFYAGEPEGLAALVPRALRLDRAAVREQAARRFSHQAMVDGYLEAYGALIKDGEAVKTEEGAGGEVYT